MKINILVFFITFVYCLNVVSQDDLVNDLSSSNDSDSFSLITEKIINISNNRKIIIISANNNGFNEGDFITLLTNNELICRAIVAKVKKSAAGIKIIKLYSVNKFKSLKATDQVQIIRGDDSYFKNKSSKENLQPISKIDEEDDLFKEDILDSRSLNKNKDSLLLTDNIVSVNYTSSSKVLASLFGLSWSYQIKKNLWLEAVFNYGVAKNWPAPVGSNIDTIFNNFIVRAKYTFKGPAYSFFQPYLGLSIMTAKATDPADVATRPSEQSLIDAANFKSITAGVTILKRLVPGWFIKLNVSLMGFGAGIALEF